MLKYNLFEINFFKRFFSRKCFDIFPCYNSEIKLNLEKYWKDQLSIKKDGSVSDKMYVLSMFPYPSGNLHMGHMRVYTVADVIARYHRLCGKTVIFPMGWDSFGLPAENAAFERHLEPKEWTLKNIGEMKQQLKDQMTLSIDWSREISTCEPQYFKWTQWIFSRLFDEGFAYQRSELVNWDPIDKTVLADELIDNEGRSWRSGAIVEKIPLKQWFLKTTAFTESLLTGLETRNGDNWRHVVDMQLGWLGKLEGIYVEFDLVDLCDNGKCLEQLAVFTTNPVAVLTDLVAFVEINANNVWWKTCDNIQTNENPSFHRRLAVKHPLSGRLIPIIKNSSLKFTEEACLSARLGIPFLNLDDARTACNLKIPLSSVHLGPYNVIKQSAWKPSEGLEWNDNLEQSLYKEAMNTLQRMKKGGYRCSKLRTDWLISRQRYWGTPIPIIHCPDCGPVLVPEDQLPVELPEYHSCKTVDSRQICSSPLATVDSWVNTACPKCGNEESKRETDTMDTFVDSSWYYLRHLDPHNDTQLCNPQVVKEMMSVDIYIGGIEHAVRHLFYARFIMHFLHYHTDIKLLNGPEPFETFVPIGLVLGQTYETQLGKFVSPDNVKYEDKVPVHIESGERLIEYWTKMSKSKHNGVNPKAVVQKYGLDTTRLVLLTNTGPEKSRKWQENDVVVGIVNWEKRVWKLIKDDMESKVVDLSLEDDVLMEDNTFINEYKSILDRILDSYRVYSFSVTIALLQKLSTYLLKVSSNNKCDKSILYHRVLFDFLVLLHPLSPLLSSELWAQLCSHLSQKESLFIVSEAKYLSLCGKWSYNLNKSVCKQDLSELSKSNLCK